ncbi:ATPase family AAA domain-containing protein 5b isoform X2 [Labrus bergylta]|uniref:ATPase family AAA domain-containing protein 5b isoform X2 n=1 Tax=Labrus bergylta TaxID=56723 RepID=UPI003313A9A2
MKGVFLRCEINSNKSRNVKMHHRKPKTRCGQKRCSDDEEKDPASSAGKDRCRDDVADVCSTRINEPLQEMRMTCGTKGVKIAPIFLNTAQHSSCDGKLDQLKERLQKSELPPHCKDHQQRLSTVSHLTKRKGSCRDKLSASVLHCHLEDIQTSNPAFPVQAVFSTLQKKASEGLHAFRSKVENAPTLGSLHSHLKEKRKRRNESSERVPKRLRSGVAAEGAAGVDHCRTPPHSVQESPVLAGKKQSRINRLSRTHRLKQQSGRQPGLVNTSELNSGLITHTQCDSLKISDSPQTDSSYDDVLWTDKYSPQHSSEVIGNSVSVSKLQSWLKKWKLRADCEERRKLEERKREENSNGSWDCGDFLGEAGAEEEPLCNTMLIRGPPGVGKTASVYACAQELGFKVFEVNCSSQRSGHHVLSQLKEATQSHLVEMSGTDPLKPAYFNNYSCTLKADTLPGKTVTSKNVSSSSKKRAAQSFGRSARKRKANPATVSLANYFKMKNKADLLHSGGLSPSENTDGKKPGNQTAGCDHRVPQNKKTATSLILFEEVDVIFDDDVGFLAAIKTFMSTTKRPVILTTNDPSFRERFSCCMEDVIYKAPSEVNVCSYLQLVALAENVHLQSDDVSGLLKLSRGDVRRSLLQLQLWVKSGGGLVSKGGGLPKEPVYVKYSRVAERGNNLGSQLPQRDTDCTASMLGLHSATPGKLQNLLQCQFWSEVDMNELLRLLAESWRRAVPFLYSNLELLLLTPNMETSVCSLNNGPSPGLQSEVAPSDSRPHILQLDEDVSPKVSATDRKPCRTTSRLSRRKHTTPVFDKTSSANVEKTAPRVSSLSKRAHRTAQSSGEKTEKPAANLVTDCLDTLTDFFDLMSYIDATVPAAMPVVSGACKPEAFVWTGAEIKDGLLDEMREEEGEEEGGRSWSQEMLLDFQAAVEGLGSHRCCCCWQSKVWSEAQKHRQELGDTEWRRLTPPVSLNRHSLSFTLQPLCAPSVSQRGYELSRKVQCSKSFSLLGNRTAVSVDYLPVLRFICRFQRAQQHTEKPLRCLNYLNSSGLGLSKSTIQLLAQDFS